MPNRPVPEGQGSRSPAGDGGPSPDRDRNEAGVASRLREIDWSTTPLGPPEGWPAEMRDALAGTIVEVARRLAAGLEEEARRRRGELLETVAFVETRFAHFMEHLPGLAWIKDLEGRYVYANGAAEAAFRRSRAELYGRTDGDLFPAAIAEQFRAHDRLALESESGTQVIERLEHADGSLHSSIVTKFRIPDARGETTLLGGMAIDVTDRIRAEEALREADRRKDEFLAVLGHELRNPLSSLANALQILRRAREPHAAAAAVGIMERQIAHVARLADDLLDVSRITRGKIELRREPVELPAAIQHCLDAASERADEQGHSLELVLPSEPLLVDADPVRLAQIVGNLLDNASKYTERGGRVAFRLARDGERAVIRVADTGVGIPPELLPHVFELFAQVDLSHERRARGLGLGLTIVRDLVELHGGSVEARSEGAGSGSEFVVRLPLAGAVAASTNRPPAPPAPLAARRILIVDDDRDAADSLAALLGLVGHVTRTVYDGAAAVAAAGELGADTVLLDLDLPGLDGFEVARRLRARPSGAGMVIVAVTGWGQPADRERSRAAGCDAHLVKPVDHAALTRLLAGRARDGER